jgi:hypothetical protein
MPARKRASVLVISVSIRDQENGIWVQVKNGAIPHVFWAQYCV